MLPVTPAQQELISYCNHANARDVHAALHNVHYTATYYADPDLVHLNSSRIAQDLYELLDEIAKENRFTLKNQES